MKTLVPLHNQILIERFDTEQLMYGNIMIPDAGKEKPMMGKVIGVGPGLYNPNTGQLVPIDSVKIGDVVLFPSFGGVKITYEDKEYIICKDNDLLAKEIENE
jgi:chaperonin GroES